MGVVRERDVERIALPGEIKNQISAPDQRTEIPRKTEEFRSFTHQFIGNGGWGEDELFGKWPSRGSPVSLKGSTYVTVHIETHNVATRRN